MRRSTWWKAEHDDDNNHDKLSNWIKCMDQKYDFEAEKERVQKAYLVQKAVTENIIKDKKNVPPPSDTDSCSSPSRKSSSGLNLGALLLGAKKA